MHTAKHGEVETN